MFNTRSLFPGTIFCFGHGSRTSKQTPSSFPLELSQNETGFNKFLDSGPSDDLLIFPLYGLFSPAIVLFKTPLLSPSTPLFEFPLCFFPEVVQRSSSSYSHLPEPDSCDLSPSFFILYERSYPSVRLLLLIGNCLLWTSLLFLGTLVFLSTVV